MSSFVSEHPSICPERKNGGTRRKCEMRSAKLLCQPVILSVVEIPASEDERQGSNRGEAERLGSRTHLMTASLCYFYLVRIALCKDISLVGCHLLGARSQAPLPCCLILTARAPARSGFRLRIRSAQDDRLTDVCRDLEFDSSDTRMARSCRRNLKAQTDVYLPRVRLHLRRN